MPGEISRSNPGPKGNVPYVPSWIEVDNLRMELRVERAMSHAYRQAFIKIMAKGHFDTCSKILASDTKCNCSFQIANDVLKKYED